MKFEEFVGAWRLAGFTLVNDDGTESEPWLEGSDGMLIYSADGYMSAIIAVVDESDGSPKHIAYSGPFQAEDDKVIHHVVMSSEPTLVGRPQTRFTEYDGTTLTLSSSPSIYGGPNSKALLSWQRAE